MCTVVYICIYNDFEISKVSEAGWFIKPLNASGKRLHDELERSTIYNGKTHNDTLATYYPLVICDISIEAMAIK